MASMQSDDTLHSPYTSTNNKAYMNMLKNQLDTIVEENSGQTQIQAVLNIYDFTKHTRCCKYIGLGIFHTGIVLYNNEFAYGKHQEDDTGVYIAQPGHSLSFAIYYKTITLPTLQITPKQVTDIIVQVAHQFKGNNYQLITNNCNDFSAALLQRLYGEDRFPFFIRRASYIAQSINNFLSCFGWELFTSDDEEQNHLTLQNNESNLS